MCMVLEESKNVLWFINIQAMIKNVVTKIIFSHKIIFLGSPTVAHWKNPEFQEYLKNLNLWQVFLYVGWQCISFVYWMRDNMTGLCDMVQSNQSRAKSALAPSPLYLSHGHHKHLGALVSYRVCTPWAEQNSRLSRFFPGPTQTKLNINKYIRKTNVDY